MGRPKKSEEDRRVVLAVYLPARLRQTLKAIAERDRRSASTQALIYLERAIEADQGDQYESRQSFRGKRRRS
jgi:hypothetical protein